MRNDITFAAIKLTHLTNMNKEMTEKKNKIRKDSEALRDFLNRFERHDKTYWISLISDGCMVPRYTVLNWAKGLSRIQALYKIRIEEIVGEEIFDRMINE